MLTPPPPQASSTELQRRTIPPARPSPRRIVCARLFYRKACPFDTVLPSATVPISTFAAAGTASPSRYVSLSPSESMHPPCGLRLRNMTKDRANQVETARNQNEHGIGILAAFHDTTDDILMGCHVRPHPCFCGKHGTRCPAPAKFIQQGLVRDWWEVP